MSFRIQFDHMQIYIRCNHQEQSESEAGCLQIPPLQESQELKILGKLVGIKKNPNEASLTLSCQRTKNFVEAE